MEPNTATLNKLSSKKAFDCDIIRYEIDSVALGGLKTTFSLILPPPGDDAKPVPVLVWLSGLTCTDENFITKAGAAQHAAAHRIAIACPDTSPRGAGAPGEDDSWDFGTGAGFYVNASTAGFERYQMETFVRDEFPRIVAAAAGERVNVAVRAISGHSMGGMGALALAFNSPDDYASVSAFAPIANPTAVPWGDKCFTGYLGEERAAWDKYDPTKLMLEKGPFKKFEILVDQGGDDSFLEKELTPRAFVGACASVGQEVKYNLAEGYDHSYFFVQTFIGKHVEFHATKCWAAMG